MRVLKGGGVEGRFALASAFLAGIATPLDAALARRESSLTAHAPDATGPILLVCGPPRSGTTLVAQLIARSLPVSYFTNLTVVFPRAPITAGRLFRAAPTQNAVTLESHYGKTARFRGPNDALHLWDRWLTPDRTRPAPALSPEDAARMRTFFGAWEREFGRPILTKNNSLNVNALVVAPALPSATFLCLTRDPVYLAQSLLLARRYIHADDRIPYGVHHPDRSEDPFEDVARQVAFYEREAARAVDALGSERFWRVAYEDACTNPEGLVGRVAQNVYRTQPPGRVVSDLQVQNQVRLDSAEFAALAAAVRRHAT
jgi:hypothetical protein